MDPTNNEQTELLRLIWNEMKAVKASVDTKLDGLRTSLETQLEGVRSEVEANRLEIEKLNEKFDGLNEKFGGLRNDFDVMRGYMVQAEIRSATVIVELRKDREELYGNLRNRVERLEEHAGLPH
ncbi:MAG: hypothetical protein GY856_34815 [bacterium]|nr:hypothetical protein [bacterium]